MPNFTTETNDNKYYVLFETTEEGVRLFKQTPIEERHGATISNMIVEGQYVPAIKIAMDKASYDHFKRQQWNEEYDFKMKSRCIVCGSNGKSKICPLRRKNPDYTETNGQPKTLANSCEDCPYGRQFKAFHNTVSVSTLTSQTDLEEGVEYEIPTPENYRFGDDYLKLLYGFIDYLKENYPQYTGQSDMVYLLGQECSVPDAAKILMKHEQTLYSWRKQIRPIFDEYMSTVIRP